MIHPLGNPVATIECYPPLDDVVRHDEGDSFGSKITGLWMQFTVVAVLNFNYDAVTQEFLERTKGPLLWNPAEGGLFVEVGRVAARGTEVAVGGDASGEQFVHQPRLDLREFRNQRVRLLDLRV